MKYPASLRFSTVCLNLWLFYLAPSRSESVQLSAPNIISWDVNTSEKRDNRQQECLSIICIFKLNMKLIHPLPRYRKDPPDGTLSGRICNSSCNAAWVRPGGCGAFFNHIPGVGVGKETCSLHF